MSETALLMYLLPSLWTSTILVLDDATVLFLMEGSEQTVILRAECIMEVLHTNAPLRKHPLSNRLVHHSTRWTISSLEVLQNKSA